MRDEWTMTGDIIIRTYLSKSGVKSVSVDIVWALLASGSGSAFTAVWRVKAVVILLRRRGVLINSQICWTNSASFQSITDNKKSGKST
mgnify:CR=1 FL=1